MWMTISNNSFCMYVYVECMCGVGLHVYMEAWGGHCIPLDQFPLYLLRQNHLLSLDLTNASQSS